MKTKIEQLISEASISLYNLMIEQNQDNIAEISTRIMDLLEEEEEYSLENIKIAFEELGVIMETNDEDEIYWKCIDYIEKELWEIIPRGE